MASGECEETRRFLQISDTGEITTVSQPEESGTVKKATSVGPTVTFTVLRKLLYGVSVAGIAYFLGYFRVSPLVCIVGVGAWLAYHLNYITKRETRMAIRRAVANDERANILAKLEDLPAWVFFPDTERTEWLNKIILQTWPFVNDYVKDLIKQTIEPSIREFLPSYLKSFRFEKIILGDLAPRIGGVKVYQENVARDEIIMDMQIAYSGDCDFQVTVKGLKAGIRDLQLHGTLRVILKPLIKQIPLVGGVTVFFLNNPALDFNLTNLADILDMPGISDLIRSAILTQLGSMLVLPNKLIIPLISDIPMKAMKFSPPIAVVRIELIEGKKLKKGDVGVLGMGKSDPYCIMTVGSQEFRSPVIDNTVNPKWNYHFEAIVDELGQSLDIEVMDQDQSSKDDFLGRVSVSLKSLSQHGKSDLWLTLEDTTTGQIHLKAIWMTLGDNPMDLPNQLALLKTLSPERKANFSTAVLMVYLDYAKHLPNLSRAGGEPSPKVVLSVGTQKQSSAMKLDTNDPVWEESFHFLVQNPEVQDLSLSVIDGKTQKSLGTLTVHLNRLLKEHDMLLEQPFFLMGSGPNAKIMLSLQLKVLKTDARLTPEKGELNDSNGSGSIPSTPDKKVPPADTGPTGQPPALDEMISSTIGPLLDVAEIPQDILNSSPRVSTPPNSLSEVVKQPTKVQLTLRYSMQRNKLVAVVHQISNVPHKEGDDLPDPYVKMYLLPARDVKQKTQIVKNNCNPVFDETLEFEGSMNDIRSSMLEVMVISKGGSAMFSKGKHVGRVLVDLSKIDLGKAITDWYELELKDD